MQRILASKNPREASLMSAIVSVCLFPRWIMIGGITLLGLVFFTPELRSMGANGDFEQVLPYVINNFLPAGMVGVLLAGLLSSFMANFSATVNAGAAYLVNDVYARYLEAKGKTGQGDAKAYNRTLVRASYVGSVLILVLGMYIGYSLHSINEITQWIVSGLFGGYTAANVLKWYWWRLNGKGYFAGMLVGMGSALAAPWFAPSLHPLYAFPFILVLSLIASVVTSLLSEPVEDETLKSFYINVRPWGFWGPVREMLERDGQGVRANTDAGRDFLNIGVGTAWQLTLVTIPLYLIFRDMTRLGISVAVLVVTSIFLKKFWYDRLEAGGVPADAPAGAPVPAPQPAEMAGD
jgi:Na+/proline symporter